jgi:hypothetical protein
MIRLMCEEAHKFKLKRVNSEGFRDPGKHLFVQEAIREHCLDFIALLRRDGQTLLCVFLIISLFFLKKSALLLNGY